MQDLARQPAGQGYVAPVVARTADAAGRACAQLVAELRDEVVPLLVDARTRVDRMCDRTRFGAVEPGALLDEMTAAVADLREAENHLRWLLEDAAAQDRGAGGMAFERWWD